MASTDWRLEMHNMLAAFNRQAIRSLGIMKTAFKQNGLSFTPEFKQHFIQASINRIIESYDEFEINSSLEEQLNMPNGSLGDNDSLLTSIHLPNLLIDVAADQMNRPIQVDAPAEAVNNGRIRVKSKANDSGSGSFNGGRCDASSANTFGTVIQIDDSDDEEAVVQIPKMESTEGRESASSSNDTGTHQSGKDKVKVGIDNESDIKPKEEEMDDDIPMVEIEVNRKVRAPINEQEENRNTINIRGTVASLVNRATKSNDQKSVPKQSKLEKQFRCIACEYSTIRKADLKKHMLKHTGEKPYRCDRCEKRFTLAQSLKRHAVTHKDDFPFHCEGCFRGFSQKDEKETHGKGCKARRYECHLCKKFVTCRKTDMKIHMRKHTGEKPFRCEICMKNFTEKSSLKTHLNTIHTRINP